MFLASRMVTLKTRQYNASKSFSWKFYQVQIGDVWSAYLEEWYILGKKQWGYAVPQTTEEHEQLKLMCQKALAFENEFLVIARDFILKRLESKDQKQRDWAEEEMQNFAKQ